MPNVSETIAEAAEKLRANGIAEPRREAASLLAFALGKDKTFLFAYPEYVLSEKEKEFFRAILERRARREPFQQIVEKQEFYGLDFFVNQDVLIPRPETEIIVEQTIKILRAVGKSRFCEVGIGSGCVAVSILRHLQNATAIGLDISPKALSVARQNAESHQVSERLELRESDVFAALETEKFDAIVSNPPYVSLSELSQLQPEVRIFEPFNALTDGADGLSIIRRVVAEAPVYLKPKGFLLLEIGYGQAQSASALFAAEIWSEVTLLPDLQGIERTVKARLR